MGAIYLEVTVEVTDVKNSQGKEEENVLDKCSQLVKDNKNIGSKRKQGHKSQVSKEFEEGDVEHW